MTSFLSLSRAMFLGFLRDKASLFFSIAFPLMFLVIFGAMFSDDDVVASSVVTVGDVPVLDELEEHHPEVYDDLFEVSHTDDEATALESVRQGDVDAAVSQDGLEVKVYYSAADQNRAAIVVNTLDGVVTQANLEILSEAVDDEAQVPTFTTDTEQVESESLTAIQFLTPGLLGFAIAISGVFGAASTLVDWRRNKILRRVRLAPVPVTSVIGARVGVSLTVSVAQLFIFIAVASLPVFGLKLTNYWWMAIPVLLAGTLAFLALGMVIAAFSSTAEGASGLSNLIVMPMAFGSGVFWPLDQSPQWLQTVSLISPLRYVNEGLLSVMVRGNGPASVLPQLGLLALFTVVLGLVAWRTFKWDDI